MKLGINSLSRLDMKAEQEVVRMPDLNFFNSFVDAFGRYRRGFQYKLKHKRHFLSGAALAIKYEVSPERLIQAVLSRYEEINKSAVHLYPGHLSNEAAELFLNDRLAAERRE